MRRPPPTGELLAQLRFEVLAKSAAIFPSACLNAHGDSHYVRVNGWPFVYVHVAIEVVARRGKRGRHEGREKGRAAIDGALNK